VLKEKGEREKKKGRGKTGKEEKGTAHSYHPFPTFFGIIASSGERKGEEKGKGKETCHFLLL